MTPVQWTFEGLAAFIGLAGGVAVGSGTVAFLIVLDIIPRLAQLTHSFGRIRLYERAVVAGSVFWTFADFFDWRFSASGFAPALFGLFAGCFVGLLAAALTEVVNVFPVLAKRLGMVRHLVTLLMAMVFGKVAGSLYEFLLYR